MSRFAERALFAYESDEDIRQKFGNYTDISIGIGEKYKLKWFVENEQYPSNVSWIAIRGTDVNERENILSDARYRKNKDPISQIWLHRGFESATREIYSDIKKNIDKKRKLYLTGHSLGGAAAAILMIWLYEEGYNVVSCYTFGQPKVTTLAGADKYRNLLNIVRVINKRDIVPYLPPTTLVSALHGRYTHFGEEIVLQDGTGYTYLDEHNASRIKSHSFWLNIKTDLEVEDHPVKNYLENIKSKIDVAKNVNAVKINNKYGLFTEAEFATPQAQASIKDYWERRNEGEFLGVDGITIKYVTLLSDKEKGAVVISSGRTESYIKYMELAYDLGKQGYSVYIHDHRGQGFSGRMTKNRYMGHVWDFDNYLEDLKSFYTQVVSKQEHKKTFLLAHSMGGGIAALYIEKYPNDFDAAALSSPMLEPSTAIIRSDKFACGMVGFVTRIRDFFVWIFGWEPKYVFKGHDYKLTPFEFNKDKKWLTHSEVRYQKFTDLYSENLSVRIGSPTSHWVTNACNAAKMARENVAKISIPVLVLQAEQDTSVTAKGQNEFCDNLKKAGNQCDGGAPEIIIGAFHELFIEKDEFRIPALTRIFDFFNAQYQK